MGKDRITIDGEVYIRGKSLDRLIHASHRAMNLCDMMRRAMTDADCKFTIQEEAIKPDFTEAIMLLKNGLNVIPRMVVDDALEEDLRKIDRELKKYRRLIWG